MGHVDEQIGADRIRDLAEASPVDNSRVGRRTGDDHLRFVFIGESLDGVVVDFLRVWMKSVPNRLKQFAAHIDRGAVSQVPTVSKRHTENHVAGLEDSQIYSLICLGSGVRLHIGVLGAEQILDAINRELFDNVDEFATTIVAPTWITLSVLVG